MKRLKLTAKILIIVSAICACFCFVSDSASAVCSATLTTSDSVSINIATSTHAGVTADSVTVETDCEGGYSVLVAGSSADNALYLGGDSTNVAKIDVSAGTKETPSAIFANGKNNYANTWGYSTAENTTVASEYFIGMTNEPMIVFDKKSPSMAGTGDVYTMYYGASVSATQTAGSYRMANDAAIVYYIVAKSLDFEVTGNPTEWTNQDVTLTIIPEDLGRVNAYSFDNGETWQSSPSKVFTENTSNVQVKVKNNEGTISSAKVVDITKIDKTPPVITFNNSIEYNSDHTTKQVPTLIATLGDGVDIMTGMNTTDELSGVKSDWPKCYYNDIQITSTDVFTTVGRYGITCKAQDNVDNEVIESREVLIRWPLAGRYVVARQGYVAEGLSATTMTDGLYKDNADTGANASLPFASKYYYTGPTVNNYVTFADTTFRILNIPVNDDIKLLGGVSDVKTAWGNRKIYDSNVYNTWSTKWWPRGQIYNNESNESHYKVFTELEKSHVDLATFYAGRFTRNNTPTIAQTVYYEQNGGTNLGGDNNPAFEGYSAYPNVSDYLKASKAHNYIANIGDTQDTTVLGIGTDKRQIFNDNSWIDMSIDQWTMNSKNDTNTDNDFWVIDGTLRGRIVSRTYYYNQQYRVVFYLKNDTILSGTGTSLDPFNVEEDWAWFDGEQVLQ